MQRCLLWWPVLVTVLLVTLSSNCASAQTSSAVEPDLIYQVSTLSALSSGVFGGDVTLSELVRHGDFGLGTFNGVDGEMIVLEGNVYQVSVDGVARIASWLTRTAFAVVTPFEADITTKLGTSVTYGELEGFFRYAPALKEYVLRTQG